MRRFPAFSDRRALAACVFFFFALDASAAERSAVVVDVASGRVLHAAEPDALRHPASLAKIMTLYLLFEDLEAGRLSLEERMPVSGRASLQAPSKLGLKPGATLGVEEAIRALVTKSANDAAVVVAERLAGSEEAFAQRMTAKARALGMARTTFRNASGLPDRAQVTTARDLALLSMAVQKHFPGRYGYFSLRAFRHAGRVHVNHNRLLGRVAGVDGVKTGFTNASGFNLAASIQRDGRHLVAVVLGHKSGPMRDAYTMALIDAALGEKSAPALSAVVPRRAAPEPKAVKTAAREKIKVKNSAKTKIAVPARLKDDSPAATAAAVRPVSMESGDWLVQVGAPDTEAEAATLLAVARSKAGAHLSLAAPMTEKIDKDGKAVYRARFAGLAKKSAQAACEVLKKRNLPCFATRT